MFRPKPFRMKVCCTNGLQHTAAATYRWHNSTLLSTTAGSASLRHASNMPSPSTLSAWTWSSFAGRLHCYQTQSVSQAGSQQPPSSSKALKGIMASAYLEEGWQSLSKPPSSHPAITPWFWGSLHIMFTHTLALHAADIHSYENPQQQQQKKKKDKKTANRLKWQLAVISL